LEDVFLDAFPPPAPVHTAITFAIYGHHFRKIAKLNNIQ